jgi:hypothetical protein
MAEENQSASGATSPDSGTAERIRKKSRETLAGKWGKNGRPPKGAYSGEAAPKVSPTAQPGFEEPPAVTPEDIEFVKAVAENALKLVDKLLSTRVYKTVQGIDPSLTVKATEFAEQVEIKPEEIKLVSDAAGAVAAKYSALARYAPELALCAWGVGYSARVISTLHEVKKLADAVNAMKPKPNNVTPMDNGTIQPQTV